MRKYLRLCPCAVSFLIKCWPRLTSTLPKSVLACVVRSEEFGRYFYPFWLLELEVSIKFPFAKPRCGPLVVMLDAITGGAVTPPLLDCHDEEAFSSEILTPKIRIEDMNKARMEQIVRLSIRKRTRALASIKYDIKQAELVYKESALMRVLYKNGQEGGLALDTLTGEYGILPAGNVC